MPPVQASFVYAIERKVRTKIGSCYIRNNNANNIDNLQDTFLRKC